VHFDEHSFLVLKKHTKKAGRTTADEPKLAATGDSTWMASIALAMAATACFTAARRLEPKQHRHEQ